MEDRLVEFALNAVLFSKDLPSDMPRQYYGNQFLRSGGSSALNFSEAQGTNTNRDYINKAGINPKELEESKVNLKILNNVEYGKATKRANLLDEVE